MVGGGVAGGDVGVGRGVGTGVAVHDETDVTSAIFDVAGFGIFDFVWYRYTVLNATVCVELSWTDLLDAMIVPASGLHPAPEHM